MGHFLDKFLRGALAQEILQVEQAELNRQFGRGDIAFVLVLLNVIILLFLGKGSLVTGKALFFFFESVLPDSKNPAPRSPCGHLRLPV